MKTFSYILNAIFIVLFFWYFFIHVGINYYVQKIFHEREFFLEDRYYQAKIIAYKKLNEKLHKDKKYIVFVGDSIIEQFPVAELFLNLFIINRGVGFDTSRGLLERIENNVNNINMSICFVMIGHNDFKYRTIDETFNIIKTILDSVKAEKVYFLSILPDYDESGNVDVKKLNDMVEEFCVTRDYGFIDLYSSFIESDNHNKNKFYYDGVHPNIEGYQLIVDQLENFIQDYL